MTGIERRFVDLQTTISGNKLGGYAAVYSKPSDIGPYWEMLEPTAFRSALATPDLDVVGLFNHDPSLVLSRTPDSLRLSSDSHGLEFEMDLIDTAVSRDVRAYVEAGLITGCSFAFVADEQRWDTYQGQDLRVHTSVDRIADVSVVTYPAYRGTSVALRSRPNTQPAINGRTQIIRAKARVHLKEVLN